MKEEIPENGDYQQDTLKNQNNKNGRNKKSSYI
jgi:hypothetical protein